MTKQDEIRDGVIVNITKACPDKLNRDVVELADKILSDEASQGVVIKVDRELPKYMPFWNADDFYDGTENPKFRDCMRPTTMDDVEKAGFRQTEEIEV